MLDTHKISKRLLRDVLIATQIREDAMKLSPTLLPSAENDLAIAYEKYTKHTLIALQTGVQND